MQVIVDTEKALSATDRAVLLALLGITETPTGVLEASQKAHTPSAEGEAGIERDTKPAAPAKKATPAKKAAAPAPKKAAEPKPQPKASDEPEADQGDAHEALRTEAKAAAKAAMDGGNRDAVVAALAAVGEKRVTTMKDENLEAFMGALQAELDNLV